VWPFVEYKGVRTEIIIQVTGKAEERVADRAKCESKDQVPDEKYSNLIHVMKEAHVLTADIHRTPNSVIIVISPNAQH
jgi:hypothetical protein